MVGKARRWDQFLSGWREYEADGHTSEAGRWQKGPGLEVKQDCTPQHQSHNNPLAPVALRSPNSTITWGEQCSNVLARGTDHNNTQDKLGSTR